MISLKRYTPWVLAIFFGAVYLLTPTMLYYWDGITFANLCNSGSFSDMLHPHHLLFNFTADLMYEYVRMHLPNVTSLGFLIFLSSIFGALTIYFSHLIFRRIFNREGLATATTSFMGLSFTFWHYSTDANAYVISAFFMVLAAYLLLTMDNIPNTRGRLVWASLVFAIGMLLHQVVVLFYPVYFFWMVAFRFKDKNKKISFLMRIALIILPGLIAGSVYFLLGRIFLNLETPDEYWNWITAYGHQKRWWFGSDHAGLPAYLRAIAVSHLKLMFYPDYIRYRLFDFSNLSLLDLTKKGLAIVSLVTVFLVFIRGIVYLIGAVGRRRFYAASLLLWILPYFIFFTFFTPQFEFYRIYYLFPLMVIFALGLKGFFEKPSYEEFDLPIRPNTLSGWVFVLLIVFGVYNYNLGIRPAMNGENNPWLMQAELLIDSLPSDAIIVVPYSDELMEEYSRTANLVEYFGTQGVLFAQKHVKFVGPIEEFVGPPIQSEQDKGPVKWEDVTIRDDIKPDLVKMYFHEALLDGNLDGWRLIKYTFPDTIIPLEGFVRLPNLNDATTIQIGTAKYMQGKKYFKLPEKIQYRMPFGPVPDYIQQIHSERYQ